MSTAPWSDNYNQKKSLLQTLSTLDYFHAQLHFQQRQTAVRLQITPHLQAADSLPSGPVGGVIQAWSMCVQ